MDKSSEGFDLERSVDVPYAQPTDLSDGEWERVQHLVEVTQTGPGPRRSVDLRAVLNAVRYKQRTGCQWRNLPADMPPRSTVHGYYRRWDKSGVLLQVEVLLQQEAKSVGASAARAVLADVRA
jgi:transposase